MDSFEAESTLIKWAEKIPNIQTIVRFAQDLNKEFPNGATLEQLQAFEDVSY